MSSSAPLTPDESELLLWLGARPGRRLTFRFGEVCRVDLAGVVMSGDHRQASEHLAKRHLLRPDGIGWWALSPRGILESAMLASPPPPPDPPPPPRLRKLPPLRRPRRRPSEKCQRHGLRYCPTCEELDQLDALAGKRLMKALERARIAWLETT